MHKDISKLIRVGIGWNATSKIAVQVYSFIISIIIARILDPKDFGIMAIGFMVVSYSNLLTNFGFYNALVQRENITSEHVNSTFTVDFIFSFLLTIFTFLAAPTIGDFFGTKESTNVIRVLSLVFLLTAFFDVPKVLLRRSIDFKFLGIVFFIEALCKSIVAITLALLGFKYWALVFGHILPVFIGGVVVMIKTKWKPRFSYNHSKMRDIYQFGVWNFIRVQVEYFNNFISQFLVARFFGPVSLGFFEKANSIAVMPLDSLAMPVNAVMFPAFSRLQNDEEQLVHWFKHLIILQCIIILPCLFGILAIAPHFILVILGEKWRFSIVPLELLCLANILRVFNGGMTSFNIGVGQYTSHTIRVAIAGLFLLIFSLLFLHLDLRGICYAYIIYTFSTSTLIFALVRKSISFSLRNLFVSVSPYLLASILMFIIVKALGSVVFMERTVINLIILVSFGVIFYVLFLMMHNFIVGRKALYPIVS